MTLPSTPSEDPLETQLRKATAPLADHGFSARVLSSLPPPAPKPHRLPSRRIVVCTFGALTGLLWAVSQSGSPPVSGMPDLGSALVTSSTTFSTVLSDPTVVAVGTVIILSLAVAFFHEIAAKLG